MEVSGKLSLRYAAGHLGFWSELLPIRSDDLTCHASSFLNVPNVQSRSSKGACVPPQRLPNFCCVATRVI